MDNRSSRVQLGMEVVLEAGFVPHCNVSGHSGTDDCEETDYHLRNEPLGDPGGGRLDRDWEDDEGEAKVSLDVRVGHVRRHVNGRRN